MKNKRLTTYAEFENLIADIENSTDFKERLNDYNKENGTDCKTIADLMFSSLIPVHKFADVKDVMKAIDKMGEKENTK